ncbi:heterokaryon incompatibility protein-domain-containing protein [Coniochaeta sp. 2T2.1]|nr:heterokaryon incompatibility protein-domain-containing protein [Coniochaeta sp. 2T2.1]
MARFTDIRDTTRLCSRCEQLFSSPQSLQEIRDEIPTTYCSFSELGSRGQCSLCTLLAEALRCSSYAGRRVLKEYDPEALEGDVRLRFAYQLSMGDDYEDEDDEIGYDTSSAPSLDVFSQVTSALGIAQSTSATQDWRRLDGFYLSADYWKEAGFTQPVLDMVDKCRQGHTRCKGKDVPLLPSMVIDVSNSSIDGQIRLHIPGQEQRAEYLALSYCWGGPQKLVTTVANLGDHQRGIQLDRLPRTIKEAVLVTASLGIRYIWVDALCIVQDDEASKAIEIENMGKIYGHATIALLVASGTSRAVDDGFLSPYADISVVPYYSTSTEHVVPACLAVGTEVAPPLDMRGWTYQERRLASRRLVFGGPRGVSFTCAERSSAYVAGAWTRSNDNGELVARISGDDDDPATRWHEMIEEYSFRSLTFDTDRLPAIAGLAQEHVPTPGDLYIAGLWKSRIIDDLMWKGQFEGMGFKIPLSQYRSPGWSWISVTDHVPNRTVGCVKNDLRRRMYAGGSEENVAYYVDHSVQLAQADAGFGRVLSGRITLRAKTVSVQSTQGLDLALLRRGCNYRLTEDEEDQLQLVLMKYASRWSMEVAGRVEDGYASLILLPDAEGTFRRLGIVWDWASAALPEREQMVDWDEVPYQEVTMI